MINKSTALLRKLREFFEMRLGLNAWNGVRIVHFGQEEDDASEFVQIEFDRNGKTYLLQAMSPEDAPPLGILEFKQRGVAGNITGPLCDETFSMINDRLRAA
jgi:hypothetical protein